MAVAIISCNSNEQGTGDREYEMQTRPDSVNNVPNGDVKQGDTTPTSNNSAYNADSASGQGSVYDTSSNNK